MNTPRIISKVIIPKIVPHDVVIIIHEYTRLDANWDALEEASVWDPRIRVINRDFCLTAIQRIMELDENLTKSASVLNSYRKTWFNIARLNDTVNGGVWGFDWLREAEEDGDSDCNIEFEWMEFNVRGVFSPGVSHTLDFECEPECKHHEESVCEQWHISSTPFRGSPCPYCNEGYEIVLETINEIHERAEGELGDMTRHWLKMTQGLPQTIRSQFKRASDTVFLDITWYPINTFQSAFEADFMHDPNAHRYALDSIGSLDGWSYVARVVPDNLILEYEDFKEL